MFQPSKKQNWAACHVVPALDSWVDRIKAAEARCAARDSLRGGPGRPLSEAVQVKSGLPWKHQDVSDARAMGYLPRKTANREWNQPKRKKCCSQQC